MWRIIIKILLLDIETAPNTAHVWGLWQQNVGLPQLLEAGYTLSWAAKWYGDNEVFWSSMRMTSAKRMVKAIHKMLNEADVVVHYNGTKFDIPTLNKEFVQYGIAPPAPFKQIDLLRTCRTQFRFPSNKLAYVAKALGIGGKLDAGGHETWTDCMSGDPKAFKRLEEYNIEDVLLLEKLYDKLKPWIKGHANANLYKGTNESGPVCPTCGSQHFHRRGTYASASLTYARYQCQKCSRWFRGAKSEGPIEKFIGV